MYQCKWKDFKSKQKLEPPETCILSTYMTKKTTENYKHKQTTKINQTEMVPAHKSSLQEPQIQSQHTHTSGICIPIQYLCSGEAFHNENYKDLRGTTMLEMKWSGAAYLHQFTIA